MIFACLLSDALAVMAVSRQHGSFRKRECTGYTWTRYAHYVSGDLYALSSRSELLEPTNVASGVACNFCHCLGTKSFLEGCFVQANGPRFVAWKYETVCGVVRYLRNVNFKH